MLSLSGTDAVTRLPNDCRIVPRRKLLADLTFSFSDGFLTDGLAAVVSATDVLSLSLINIALVTAFFPQAGHVSLGLFLALAAFALDNAHERGMDVRGHGVDAAADVEVGPFLQPAVKLAALLQHAMLHVHLVALVAREGHVQPRQHAQFQPSQPFDLVQK